MGFRSHPNWARTTLASDYIPGSGVATVADASGFGSPTITSPIALVFANAGIAYTPNISTANATVFLCTGISENTLILTPAEGTTDRIYVVGDVVECRLTGGDLLELQDAIDAITIGPEGPTGVQGVQGNTGVAGQTGVGIQGNTGITGATGVQGIQGNTGVQGNPGSTGVGVQGNTGVQGIQGNQGQTGSQGLQGNTGMQGLGATGVSGPTGVQGVQGNTGVAGQGSYNNLTPTPAPLGGIGTGTTFTDQTMSQLFDALLYPYQSPAFTSFNLTNYAGTLEVGSNTSSPNPNFTFGCSNTGNINAGSLYILKPGGATGVGGLSSNSSPQNFADSETQSSPGTLTWIIKGMNTHSTQFTASASLTWLWREYHGNTTQLAPTNTQVVALGSALVSGFAGVYAFGAISNGYPTMAFPVSFGTPSSFKDLNTGFGVGMAAPYQVTITNSYGVSASYNVFQTFGPTSGALTIVVS